MLFKVLGELVVSMSEDWESFKTNEELQNMWKNARNSRLISITVIVLANSTIIAFCFSILFNERSAKHYSNNTKMSREKRLYFNSEFFYDVQHTPFYELTCICQSLSSAFAACSFSATDAFFVALILHLCSQLNNFSNWVKKIPRQLANENEGHFRKIISEIVDRHETLNRFAKTIEDAFNVVFLVEVITVTILLCLQGYQLISIITSNHDIPVFETAFLIYYILVFGFSLFAYCYIAEILRVESLGIGKAIYESDWYTLPPAYSKIFVLIIIRAKEPLQLTAGKFAVFSLELFCQVLKSSAGYLSLLLAIKTKLNI